MSTTLQSLLAVAVLDLKLISGTSHLDQPISWVSSTDLSDPTPFLADAQVVLTTGRQFAAYRGQTDYDDYVARLREGGVIAIGFGTEVFRKGTPAELASACVDQSVSLFEIPYDTPFIAVIRTVADAIARDARARDDWALQAQSAISLAALGDDGLAHAVAEASRRLRRKIGMFDADGMLVMASPGVDRWVQDAEVVGAAAKLLRRASRARLAIQVDGEQATLQTLGKKGHLRGVIVVAGGTELDKAELSAVTILVALAEVSLENSQSHRESIRSLLEQLFHLLLAGQVDAVRAALKPMAIALPTGKFVVAMSGRADVAPEYRNTLERWAAEPSSQLFVADHDGHVVVLVPARSVSRVIHLFDGQSCPMGISEPADFARLGSAVVQARRALEHAQHGEQPIVRFDDMVQSSLLGLLSSSAVAEIARARLSVLLDDPDGLFLLECASVWLNHNGQWDAAAKEVGIHRHSLRARIQKLERMLGLSFERFGDRAQMWALLTSVDLGGTGAPQTLLSSSSGSSTQRAT